MRALLLVLLFACGAAEPCPVEHPNPTPEGLCCDAQWHWCLTPDGRSVGAP